MIKRVPCFGIAYLSPDGEQLAFSLMIYKISLMNHPLIALSSKYLAADFNAVTLSLNIPNPLLQALHNSPLTLVVVWLWSMTSIEIDPQIAHLLSCC